MISLLHSCTLLVDNGEIYDETQDLVIDSSWEPQWFDTGEEIDETDSCIDISSLTEGEDFVRID